MLPQYKEEEKDEGLRLGKGGEVDIVKKQQLEDVKKKLQAVKANAYLTTISVIVWTVLFIFY